MKTIPYAEIISRVAELCREAARNLPSDTTAALERGRNLYEEAPALWRR